MKGIKTGGRVKGTSNRVTGKVRESITQLIEDNINSILQDMRELEPKERLDVLCKLLPYCIPKLANVEYNETSSSHRSALLEHIESLKISRNM